MTLPDCTLAVLRRRRTLPDERRTAALDALVVLTAPNDIAFLRGLPESRRWLGLHARDKPVALSTRSTTLANPRQTFAQLAYAKAGASSFERLHLAGKLLTKPMTNPIGCNVKWDGKDAHWMPAEACDLV